MLLIAAVHSFTRAAGSLYVVQHWDDEFFRTKVCARSIADMCTLACAVCCLWLLPYHCLLANVQPMLTAHAQRETAAAHSGAAWERLKDAFTLSDSPPEITESDSSLPHKLKLSWNNGTQSTLCCHSA